MHWIWCTHDCMHMLVYVMAQVGIIVASSMLCYANTLVLGLLLAVALRFFFVVFRKPVVSLSTCACITFAAISVDRRWS